MLSWSLPGKRNYLSHGKTYYTNLRTQEHSIDSQPKSGNRKTNGSTLPVWIHQILEGLRFSKAVVFTPQLSYLVGPSVLN